MMGPGKKSRAAKKKNVEIKKVEVENQPVEHNDRPKLELSRAWEPLCRHCILSFGEREGS